jgi:hypothetical protein
MLLVAVAIAVAARLLCPSLGLDLCRCPGSDCSQTRPRMEGCHESSCEVQC